MKGAYWIKASESPKYQWGILNQQCIYICLISESIMIIWNANSEKDVEKQNTGIGCATEYVLQFVITGFKITKIWFTVTKIWVMLQPQIL